MKQKKKNPNLSIYRANAPQYPNAADNQYVIRKILDIATGIASGMGLVTAMVFLITLT